MAHILIITSGLTGIANASLELGSRIQQLGHQVTMSSMRDRRDFYEKYNFKYEQMPEIVEEIDPALPKHIATSNKLIKKLYRSLYKSKLREQAYRQMYPSQYISQLEMIGADLAIIDTELHEFILPTVALRKPLLILSQWFQLREFDNLPYLLTDTIPGVGTAGSTSAIKENWAAVRRNRSEIFIRKAAATNGTDRRSLIHRLAAEVQFPVEKIADNHWPGPITYSGQPMITMTAAELEFPYDKPEDYSYVGPMVYKGRKQDITIVDMEKLQHFLEQRTKWGSKLVVCTVSTMSAGDVGFINKVVGAIEKLNDIMLVVGLGGKLTAADVAIESERVLALPYVPMLQLLPEADLSINHGGIHTINECIEFGVPMLVYSGKKSDQNGCAARVHYHKLGRRGDKDEDDSTAIAAKINTILDDTQYKKNIETIQAKMDTYKQNTALEMAINKALAK